MIVSQSRSAFNAGFSGEFYEEEAARFLELGLGFRVVARRMRGRGFELDLIVAGPDGLVVVEVKGSRTVSADALLERVDYWKLRRMMRGLSGVRREFGAMPVAVIVVGVSVQGLAKGGSAEFSWAVVEALTTDF